VHSGGLSVEKNIIFGGDCRPDPSTTLYREGQIVYTIPSSNAVTVSQIVNLYAIVFSGANLRALSGQWDLPHDWLIGSPIDVHIHWFSSDLTVGYIDWQLTYTICVPGNAVDTTGSMVPTTVANDTVTANLCRLNSLATIDMSSVTADGASLLLKLVRQGGTDTYNGAAYMISWSTHYRVGRTGSSTY
jgi:hypothetical protein